MSTTVPNIIEDGIEWFATGPGNEDCRCARCGSSAYFEVCDNCGGDGEALGSDCIDDLCHGGDCIHGDAGFITCDWCDGEGGWWRCISGREWCEANPMPGRESIESTALPASARATDTTPEGEGA